MISRSTPNMRSSILAAIAIVAQVGLAGCAGGVAPIGLELRERTSFQSDWKRYERVRSSKAFAYAGDPAGLAVTGMAYGMGSPIDAQARALDYCEEQRVARGLADPCVLLAVDEEILRVSAEVPATAHAGS